MLAFLVVLLCSFAAGQTCLPGQRMCGNTCCPNANACCDSPGGQKGCATAGATCCPFSKTGYCEKGTGCCASEDSSSALCCNDKREQCCDFADSSWCSLTERACCYGVGTNSSCDLGLDCCPLQSSYVCFDNSTVSCCGMSQGGSILCNKTKLSDGCCDSVCVDDVKTKCCTDPYAQFPCALTDTCCFGPYNDACCDSESVCCMNTMNSSSIVKKKAKRQSSYTLCANPATSFCCPYTDSGGNGISVGCPLGTLCCAGGNVYGGGCCVGFNATSYVCGNYGQCPQTDEVK